MNREVHVRFWERLEVKLLRATRHQEPPRFVTGATGASPETGRGGGAPMIGNLKLASSMTLIRRLGSPTYWRDCATTPRVGSSKCCRGIGKPLAWQSRSALSTYRLAPISLRSSSDAYARAMHDASCSRPSTERARAFAHVRTRVLSRPTAWGMCWDNSQELQHVCPQRAMRLGRLSFFLPAPPPAWFALG